MDNTIELMLATALAIGNINSGDIREATKYLPKTIRFGGVSMNGERFELELTMGEKNADDT